MTDFLYVQLGDGGDPVKAIKSAEREDKNGDTLVDAWCLPGDATGPGGREVRNVPLTDDHTGPDDDDTDDAHRRAQYAWPSDKGNGQEPKKSTRKSPAKKDPVNA
jgi:hypothetical protein